MTCSSPNIFNGLLSVEEANQLFTDRKPLEQLLRPFRGHTEFGITMLHRHTTLQDGEIMVVHPINDKGEIVTQPEIIDPTKVYYESSWLSTGEPIEYSLEPLPGIPDGLLKSFVKLMRKLEVPTFHHDALDRDIHILGVCGSPAPLGRDKIYVEKTEGRSNIVTIKEGQMEPQGIITLWTAVGTDCWCSTVSHSGVQKCAPAFCFTVGLTYNPPTGTS